MAYINSTPLFNSPVFDGKTYLTDEEYKQVEVLFEALVPADYDRGIPGASDAKAARFLSQLLALDEAEYYKIPEWRTAYREGLKLLDDTANSMYDKKLTALSFIESHNFLEILEKGRLDHLPDGFNQYNFFKMLLEHCLKGCFADPRWGGNDNGIMWRWLGWIQPAEDIKLK